MVSLTALVAGDWYITIACACGERLVLFADLTQGKGSLHGSFTVTCPTCQKEASYPAEHYHYEPDTEPQIVRHAS